MARKESRFNTEIKNSIVAAGGWAHKLPDPPRGGGGEGRTFTTKRPCDLVYFFRNNGGVIESKFQRGFKAFGGRLAEHQIETLNQVVATGNEAWVFLNIYVPRETNRLLAFPWPDNRLVEGPSYKKQELIDYPYHVECEKGLFDIARVLEEYIVFENWEGYYD